MMQLLCPLCLWVSSCHRDRVLSGLSYPRLPSYPIPPRPLTPPSSHTALAPINNLRVRSLVCYL
jgi:hypothetical protein